MPGKLRRLSGSQVAELLRGFGFEQVGQRGSHVKLRRISETGEKQTLHVPLHQQLRTGTLRAIVRQASQYIPIDQLRKHFFED